MSLENRQRPIDLALVNELIATTPECWDEISLIIRCDKSSQVNVEIIGPSTSNERVSASEILLEHSLALVDLLRSHGGALKEARYRAQLRQDSSWTFNAKFEYY